MTDQPNKNLFDDMGLFNAAESAQKSHQNADGLLRAELRNLMDIISSQSYVGERIASVSYISVRAKKVLQNLGYKVRFSWFRFEYDISWKHPKLNGQT